MNGLHVGQRVRKVAMRRACDVDEHCTNSPHDIGATGIIVEPLLKILSGELAVLFDSGVRRSVMPYMIEPIRDDWDTDATPNAVASWAGGVWTPERVRA